MKHEHGHEKEIIEHVTAANRMSNAVKGGFLNHRELAKKKQKGAANKSTFLPIFATLHKHGTLNLGTEMRFLRKVEGEIIRGGRILNTLQKGPCLSGRRGRIMMVKTCLYGLEGYIFKFIDWSITGYAINNYMYIINLH